MDHERWLLKGAVVLVMFGYTGAGVVTVGSVGSVGVGAGTYSIAAWDRDLEEAADAGCDGAVLLISSESEESESRTLNADIRCVRLNNRCKPPTKLSQPTTRRFTITKWHYSLLEGKMKDGGRAEAEGGKPGHEGNFSVSV